MKKNILITGMPKSGKSTLLKKLILDYPNKVGFLTNEVRENGERVSFYMETHAGDRETLASVNIKSDIKVSRYFVDLESLEKIIPKVAEFKDDDLLFLDEIGQMELYSENFKQLAIKYLDSTNVCLATVSKIYSDDFIEQIKKRDDVILVEITEENREQKEKFLAELVKKVYKAKKYLNDLSRFVVNADNAVITSDHGTRNLVKSDDVWRCNCDFFQENMICSHQIALEAYLSK